MVHASRANARSMYEVLILYRISAKIERQSHAYCSSKKRGMEYLKGAKTQLMKQMKHNFDEKNLFMQITRHQLNNPSKSTRVFVSSSR